MNADPIASPETPAGPNFLTAAVRRWPWVAVGVAAGMVGGFVMLYLTRPPVYQSRATLLVQKKRNDPTAGNTDSRMSYMEDYVATQVTLLTSERILLQAAKNLPAGRLNMSMPEDDASRGKVIGGMLTVMREKDAATGNTGGTNILTLTVKGANPDDCEAVLQTVITTYQKELDSVYDETTQERKRLLDELIRADSKLIDGLQKTKADDAKKLSEVTPEELPVIRARISELTKAIRNYRDDEAELETKIGMIAKAGPDPRNRNLILIQIADAGRGSAMPGKIDLENPDNSIKMVELERAEQLKKYREEHAVIIALDAKLAYLRALTKKSDVPGAAPEDGLAVLGKVLESRLAQTKKKVVQAEGDLKADSGKILAATPIAIAIEDAVRTMADKSKTIDGFRNQVQQLEVMKNAGGYQASVINKPSRDGAPIAPRLSQALMVGFAAGLFIGLGLATLAELADKSFRSPAEIRSRLGLPVIGHIPPIRVGLANDTGGDFEPTLVTALRPKSVEAEAYRGVRTSLYFSLTGRNHAVIQVTSPNPGDGKSTLAANLAVSIAQSGKRVILIDCDFRRPRMHKIFHIDNKGYGFVSVIAGETNLKAAVQQTSVENLYLLPCGPRPSNPAELLTSPQFVKVLEQAKAEFDFVILDTPPLLAVSDPSVVAPRADGVILVFRMTSKARPQAERAREQLAQLGANVLGVVVNGAGRASDGYGYGNGAGYHYQYEYEYAESYHDDAGTDEADEAEPAAPAVPKKG